MIKIACASRQDCYYYGEFFAGRREFSQDRSQTSEKTQRDRVQSQAMNSQSESIASMRFGQTTRRDLWWIQTTAVFIILSAFAGYATWAAMQGTNYYWGPY